MRKALWHMVFGHPRANIHTFLMHGSRDWVTHVCRGCGLLWVGRND